MFASHGNSASVATEPVVPSDEVIVGRLAREFAAPVGLLDPATLVWRYRLGRPAGDFPGGDATLTAVLGSGLLGHGRVLIWRPGPEAGPTWLALPIPRGEAGDLIALIGFAPEGKSGDGWGPPCPDRALRAWGQAVADGWRGEAFSRSPGSVGNPRFDNGDRLLVGRLIRRLRVSDPPERFQEFALQSLRSALRVASVAWVPSVRGEPIVAAGEVAGLTDADYRAFLPADPAETVLLNNEPAPSAPAGVRRAVAVLADSPSTSGWIVALNPVYNRRFAAAEVDLIRPVASLIGTQRTNGRLYGELKELLFGIIRSLTAAIDAKDPYTSGHSERVARIAVRLGEELQLSVNDRGDLYLMGLLHDVGKIGVEDRLLRKAEALTPDEYRAVQSHVSIGVHILSDLKKLHHLLPGVAHHHENYDGSGYPDHLKGEEIPLAARILAVADGYDAMSSTRPYRRRMTPMAIDEILRRGTGIQWDPRVIAAFFDCRCDIEQIRQKGLGESLQLAINETIGRS